MNSFFENFTGKAVRAVKNWWLYLIGGILLLGTGIVVFCNPGESYLTLALGFGIVFLATGIGGLVVSLTSRNFFMMRGYNIAGAVLDILIGILLCAHPRVNMVILPMFLGFWLMYHSFMILGVSGDLRTIGVRGTGKGIATGILLLLLSFFIIFKPFSVGQSVIVILTGVALVLVGLTMILGAIRLRRLHSTVKDIFDNDIDEQ